MRVNSKKAICGAPAKGDGIVMVPDILRLWVASTDLLQAKLTIFLIEILKPRCR